MRWYNGNIAEAVALSKSKNAYFVVYIEGADDLSKLWTETIDKPEITSRLEDIGLFVAIKIISGSESYKHFEQIYLVVPDPCLYFINTQTGVPDGLIFGEHADLSKVLIDKLDELKAKKSMKPEILTSHSPSTSNMNPNSAFISAEKQDNAQKSTNVSKSEPEEKDQSSEKPTEEGYKIVCEDGVCKKIKIDTPTSNNEDKSSSSSDNTENAMPDLSIDEKVERAKELLEKKRKEKMEEEKQLEKQREIERRAQGHGLAELKKWQQEQELKNLKEERLKEKQENEKARARILAQIAQDRAERQKQFTPQPSESSSAEPVSQPSTSKVEDKSTVTKIQFRQADGAAHTTQVDSDSTLGELRQYVRQNIQSSGTFTLSTMYPRQTLPQEKDGETMRMLGLHPSSVLLLLRGSSISNVTGSSAPVANTGGFFGMISQLLWSVVFQPAYGIWNWLSSFVGGNQRGGSNTGTSSPTSKPETSQENRRFPSENENEVKRRRGNQSGGGGGTTTIRREGNTYRLKDNDSDDENNTWNGNSTQQM